MGLNLHREVQRARGDSLLLELQELPPLTVPGDTKCMQVCMHSSLVVRPAVSRLAAIPEDSPRP